MILPNPYDLADQLVADAPSVAWVRQLTDRLDHHLRVAPLERFLEIWGLTASDAARVMGVSRQALSKWRQDGVPAERQVALSDLSAATELLALKVKRERIPAVVRRPAPMLEGRSLLEMAEAGQTREVKEAVYTMFDLTRVQP